MSYEILGDEKYDEMKNTYQTIYTHKYNLH